MRIAALALCTTLAFSGAVTASGAQTPPAQKATQPKVGSTWTGAAANGGKVVLRVGERYNSGTQKVMRIPKLKWTKVRAMCRRFNGTDFVEAPEKITVRIEPTTDDGAIRKGKFNWEYFYGGQRIALFKGTFKRLEMKGTAQVFEYHFVEPNHGSRSCKWGPLELDLARSDSGD